MRLLVFIYVAVTLMLSDGFIVKGPSGPLVAPLGSSVVLPCYVDELLPMKDLEVEWRRTDSEIIVHLFLDGESQAEFQQQGYRDRAHFFTDQIQHGNFSLRLDNLRAEDQGKYTCTVFSQKNSGQTFVEIKEVEYLMVSGSDESISAYVGEDVTLNCSVDSHITPEHIEEVSWKKTDENVNIQILILQRNRIQPDSSNERYRYRVEFFMDEISKGNFSLRLKRVRHGDKGVYICHVKTGHLSANTTALLEQLGFSVSHTMILALCVTASGSALLLWCLIYCRLQNDWITPYLYICLNFLPNIMMFVALILWGISEGFLHETVACSAQYLLRPNKLFRAEPHTKRPCEFCNKWMNFGLWSFIEYSVFTAVVYPVIWPYILDSGRSTFFFKGLISSTILMVVLFLCLKCCADWKKYKTIPDMLEAAFFTLLGILVFFVYLFLASGFLTTVIFITGFVPLLASLAFHGEDTERLSVRFDFACSCLAQKRKWFGVIIPVNIVMISFYIGLLRNHKGAIVPSPLTDHDGWACVIGFLQIQWTLMDLTWTYNKSDCLRNTFVYWFGSVGVVLVSSIILMRKLMLKLLNGERTVDLRIVLFPVESLFAFSLLVLQILTPGEAHVLKGRDRFVAMISFFLILVAFLFFFNYLQ